jgi:monoamine oxidase
MTVPSDLAARDPQRSRPLRRRDWLAQIGRSAGSTAMYHAMSALGFAAASTYAGPIELQGAPQGATVLVLGAGIAGLVAAYELRRAGYRVQVLEYNDRAGGRAWTLRGGDEYTELGGATQRCEFDPGLYINPGPWRIPYHHHAVLDYAHRFGVALEPFTQVNYNAYLHSKRAYGGTPQRLRHVQADFHGHVAELLGKALHKNALDAELTPEDRERWFDAMRHWGALDATGRYRANRASSNRRGYEVSPGGGSMPAPVASMPLERAELLQSGLWRHLTSGQDLDFQSAIFQPVGGMDAIAKAIYSQVSDLVQFGARVSAIDQDDHGVTVTYADAHSAGAVRRAQADWCVCTIPLSILSQLELTATPALHAAIDAVPYQGSVKVGLQFRRRFWEHDERIYGGITYTDLPIGMIGYPATGYGGPGKGVLLGAYIWGPNAYEFTARSPQERIRLALQFGAQIHPQYEREFDTGVAVGWHRVPWSLGCFGDWTDEARAAHYRNLCEIDGRIVLAGEHASQLPAWQEGAVLSSLDAIARLHRRITA